MSHIAPARSRTLIGNRSRQLRILRCGLSFRWSSASIPTLRRARKAVLSAFVDPIVLAKNVQSMSWSFVETARPDFDSMFAHRSNLDRTPYKSEAPREVLLHLFERRTDTRFRDRAYHVEKDPATGPVRSLPWRYSQNAAGAGYPERARGNRRYEENDESEKRGSRNSGDCEPHCGHHACRSTVLRTPYRTDVGSINVGHVVGASHGFLVAFRTLPSRQLHPPFWYVFVWKQAEQMRDAVQPRAPFVVR
jgi:hypothetical protein